MASDDGGRGFHSPSCFFILAAFELENHFPLPTPLDATAIAAGTWTCWNASIVVQAECFGRALSWCAPLSVASAAPSVTARCSQARIDSLIAASMATRSDPSMTRACHSIRSTSMDPASSMIGFFGLSYRSLQARACWYFTPKATLERSPSVPPRVTGFASVTINARR